MTILRRLDLKCNGSIQDTFWSSEVSKSVTVVFLGG